MPIHDQHSGSGSGEKSGSLSLASALAAAGDLADARLEIESYLGASGPSAEVLRLYGFVLWTARDLRVLRETFEPLSNSADPELRAIAALQVGRCEMGVGRYEAAASSASAALSNQDIGSVPARDRAELHALLGRCFFRLRMPEVATNHLRVSTSLFEASGHREGVADSLILLGLVEKGSDRWDQSEALTLQALATYRGLADPTKVLTATINLSVLRIFRGRFEAAIDPARRAVVLADELGDMNRRALSRVNLGLLLLRSDDNSGSREMLGSALRLATGPERRRTRALAHEYLGELALKERRLGDAARWLARGRTLAAINPDTDILGELDCREAEVHLANGAAERALKSVVSAKARFEESQDAFEVAVASRVLGEVLSSLQRFDEARVVLEAAAAFFRRIGERFESAKVEKLLHSSNSAPASGWGTDSTLISGGTRTKSPARASVSVQVPWRAEARSQASPWSPSCRRS